MFPKVPSQLIIRQINFRGRSTSVPLSTRTVTPPPPYVVPPRTIRIQLGGRNNLNMAPPTSEDHFQTQRDFSTPPPNVPINSIRTPPPTVERINTLLPPFASTSASDSPVNAQPSSPTASLGLGDTIETIGAEDEGQDINVELPFSLLDTGMALLIYITES